MRRDKSRPGENEEPGVKCGPPGKSFERGGDECERQEGRNHISRKLGRAEGIKGEKTQWR